MKIPRSGPRQGTRLRRMMPPMALRLLHTSDWHLGHVFHGVEREYEHRIFLDWLLDTLEAEAIDALLIAGDVSMWLTLAFPVWVLIVSALILLRAGYIDEQRAALE